MIGDVGIEPQSTEPAIGQIEMDLLAQPTLRTNAEAIADDEHPDHQLRVNRGPPHVAIVGPQMRPSLRRVERPSAAGTRNGSGRGRLHAARALFGSPFPSIGYAWTTESRPI